MNRKVTVEITYNTELTSKESILNFLFECESIVNVKEVTLK